MSHFHIEADHDAVQLRLDGELTVEQAGELHRALVAVLRPETTLKVNAAGTTRLDSAILQLLVAAAGSVARVALTASSAAWVAAFRRYAIADPYSSSSA